MSWALPLALLVGSCHRPAVNPHYVLGAPYPAGGVWYYPHEKYEGLETGLATVYSSDHRELTANGELFDQTALAAAHQTLQLPAIGRLTNLANGLQVLVRINDRGPTTPHRLIEVTRRTAILLRFPPGSAARVRLEILPMESYAVAEEVPGKPELELAAAPREPVQQSDLPPAASAAPVDRDRIAVAAAAHGTTVDASVSRIPEEVTKTTADPGQLFIQLGTFQNYEYAAILRARVGRLGARILNTRNRTNASLRVVIGPLPGVNEADMMLDQVLLSGVTDARIVVE
jgi:rare lipoprotein A